MTDQATPKPKPEPKPRPDRRRQFLTVMDPLVIKELKKAALDAGVPAYEIVEIAVRQYLKSRTQ